MKRIWDFYNRNGYIRDEHIIEAGRLYVGGRIDRDEFVAVLDKRPDWDKDSILAKIDARIK